MNTRTGVPVGSIMLIGAVMMWFDSPWDDMGFGMFMGAAMIGGSLFIVDLLLDWLAADRESRRHCSPCHCDEQNRRRDSENHGR